MEDGTEKKDNSRGLSWGISHLDHRDVEMTHAPPMNWHVPCTPEGVNVIRIPPITIKIAICKIQQFADRIKKRVEH